MKNIVVAIDGPSGAGKGTVAQRVAEALGFHLLDSGAVYRLAGLAASRQDARIFDDVDALATLARNMRVEFKPTEGQGVQTLLEGEDVTHQIRNEKAGAVASKIATLQPVRDALLDFQRKFDKAPGLVADGRDMGTVVFPYADVKVFLTASAHERAVRRYKQLIEKGCDANLSKLKIEIEARDRQDMERAAAPLRQAADAVYVDSTEMSIEAVVEHVVSICRQVMSDLR